MLSGISHLTQPVEEVQLGEVLVELHLHNFVISTASGALVVGGVRDIVVSPEIGLSVQWSITNQSVAVSGSLW